MLDALEAVGDLAQRIEEERAWEVAGSRSREVWGRMEYEYTPHTTVLTYEDLDSDISDLVNRKETCVLKLYILMREAFQGLAGQINDAFPAFFVQCFYPIPIG